MDHLTILVIKFIALCAAYPMIGTSDYCNKTIEENGVQYGYVSRFVDIDGYLVQGSTRNEIYCIRDIANSTIYSTLVFSDVINTHAVFNRNLCIEAKTKHVLGEPWDWAYYNQFVVR